MVTGEQILDLLAAAGKAGEHGKVTVPATQLCDLITAAVDLLGLRAHPACNSLLVVLLIERSSVGAQPEAYPGEHEKKRELYDLLLETLQGPPLRQPPKLRVIGGGRV